MAELKYNDIPSVQRFQKDSSVTFATRKDDRILVHLDWLLERYNARQDDWSLRRIILCDLFLTANFWVKSFHENNKSILKERYPAVLALFEVTVDKLCLLLGVGKGALALQIEEMVGRDNTPAGKQTDFNMSAKIFDAKVREVFRIKFRDGLLYHNFPEAKVPGRLVKLNSEDYYTKLARRAAPGGAMAHGFEGWGPFVMTLERVFYMTKHTLNEPGLPNIFHSSYTGGGTISAAGTMLVVDGRLKGLRPDSGHYKPLAANTLAALQALGMFGVKLQEVMVYDFMGSPAGSGAEFVKDQAKWKTLLDARDNLKDLRGTNPVPPPLPPRPGVAAQPAQRVYAKTPGGTPGGSSGEYNS
jgi:hypothetical protein